MMAKFTLAGCAAVCATATLVATQEPVWNAAAIKECDRVCLVAMLDGYVNAIVTHDPKAAPPLAADVRMTDGDVLGARRVDSSRRSGAVRDAAIRIGQRMDTRLGALIVVLVAIQAGPTGPALHVVPQAGPQGPALHADERFRIVPDASGEITFFIGDAVDKSGYRSGDSDLMVWALQEWERRVDTVRFRRVDEQQRARLRVRWLPWAEDAALGRMQPSTEDGHAVVSLDIRPDEDRFRPTVWRRVREDPLMRDVVIYYVCLHEIGHALGLDHSQNARDIMWPGTNGVTLPIYERYRHHLMTRDDIPRVDWLSEHDVARVKAIW